MSYATVLEAVRIAGLNNKAAGEVFSYLVTNSGSYSSIRDSLQQMGAAWAGGAERLAYDIANSQGYAEIRAALVSCGAAHDGAADLLAYELNAATLPVPPATNLLINYDGSNLDGTMNSSLIDGQGMGTIVNAGSGGAAYNQVQAVGANQPLYRAVAAAGKINNKPAVEGSGTHGMASSAIVLAQPTTWFALVKVKSSQAGGGFLIDGNVTRQQWGFISLQSRLFAGGGAAVSGQSVTLNTWQLVVAQFNDVASFARMDGVQSGALSPGNATLDLLNFMQGAGASSRIDALVAQLLGYNALLTAPQIAAVEAYFVSRFGTTPQ